MTARETFDAGLLWHHWANTAYPLTPASFRPFRQALDGDTASFLEAEWAKARDWSLYLHVPFCQVRCKFCEYVVIEKADDETMAHYVSLLIREMGLYAAFLAGKPVVGFDVGGGTPTRLPIAQLERLTRAARDYFPIGDAVVASIETTPAIAAREADKIQAARDLGYGRISMGIQTVSEKLLNDLGREGTISLYEKARDTIRKAGFTSFNVDLMYGFLHQRDAELEDTVRYAIGLGADHITLYRNRYKGTAIEEEAGGVSLYAVVRQYRLLYRILTEAGYRANPGKNTFSRLPDDWGTSDYLTRRVIEGTPYLGLGLGAQSFGIDYLAYNEGAANKKLEGYEAALDAGRFPLQDLYRLPREESMAKMLSVAFYFGFVDPAAFARRFGVSFEESFREELAFVFGEGFMEKATVEGREVIALTPRGADYINGIIPLFYSKASRGELATLGSRHSAARTVGRAGEETFLKAYRQEEYERPSLAVDIAAFTLHTRRKDDWRKLPVKELAVLLIRRGEYPFFNDWALPGGFVRRGETALEAARRELAEETGARDVRLFELGLFSTPCRDPRGWIVSDAWMAMAPEGSLDLRFGDDAIDARWFSASLEPDGSSAVRLLLSAIDNEGDSFGGESGAPCKAAPCVTARIALVDGEPAGVLENGGLAFDHALILARALSRFKTRLASEHWAFDLLGERFTLTELQNVHEAILGERLSSANFRRKLQAFVEETGETTEGAGHRPAMLWRRKA